MTSMIGGKGVLKTYRRAWRKGSAGAGFSLVEMLVVISIFTVASVAITATSINLTRLHRRTANAERLGEELRNSMELLVRVARNRRIVYPALPGTLPAKSESLTFVDANGSQMTVARRPATDAVCLGTNGSCIAINVSPYGWVPVTGKNVNVTRFDIYVTPQADPFTLSSGAYANDIQPRMTFVLDATYVTTSTKETASLGIQTTVASRVYVR